MHVPLYVPPYAHQHAPLHASLHAPQAILHLFLHLYAVPHMLFPPVSWCPSLAARAILFRMLSSLHHRTLPALHTLVPHHCGPARITMGVSCINSQAPLHMCQCLCSLSAQASEHSRALALTMPWHAFQAPYPHGALTICDCRGLVGAHDLLRGYQEWSFPGLPQRRVPSCPHAISRPPTTSTTDSWHCPLRGNLVHFPVQP